MTSRSSRPGIIDAAAAGEVPLHRSQGGDADLAGHGYPREVHSYPGRLHREEVRFRQIGVRDQHVADLRPPVRTLVELRRPPLFALQVHRNGDIRHRRNLSSWTGDPTTIVLVATAGQGRAPAHRCKDPSARRGRNRVILRNPGTSFAVADRGILRRVKNRACASAWHDLF